MPWKRPTAALIIAAFLMPAYAQAPVKPAEPSGVPATADKPVKKAVPKGKPKAKAKMKKKRGEQQ
jgi:hypothetical protein